MSRMLWIERRFAFDFPAEHTPEILERLRGTPVRLEERVAGLPSALLTRREGEQWSIQEQAGHLIEVELLFAGRLADYTAGRAELRPAEMSGRSTYAGAYNTRELPAILAGFRKARGDFLAAVAAMGPEGPPPSAPGTRDWTVPCACATCSTSWPSTTITTWPASAS